ncbi:beta-ketoacyl-[acyl-carrier-protein] synthase family protein [Geomonas propionica]|uniref:Beta-ketoacyl-[acyl-carrier-protein] synthase family protein n=1 Tax=Geomonas propionica TaxID=2798582 RepID=A0ABS0YM42_9BACT|nr:beta-ketoacyl-[acyl-carrier-protein] synthase family protein [Geomonas propionica]MBJ6798590.1 beta-ketoacyl-[acyl-carrier-protein] synthase family protein [Geomonas propionica]
MLLRRVVITGVGTISPFGRGVASLMDGLLAGKSGVVELPALAEITGMRTRVAALATGVEAMEIPRKFRRSMSNMSIFATLAAQDAVAMAGLAPEQLGSGRLGVSIGSTTGSPQTMEEFFREFNADHSLERMKSTLFFHIMNHSCASNVAQALGVTGRVLAPAAACSTSTHAIGYGAEMIGLGKQDFMLCGGADEFHPLTSGTFDIINAASAGFNDTPHQTPRPFDLRRDGIVCGEGSGILLLESLDSALARGAEILAELTGFATNSDPGSIANPDAACIAQCMRLALADAGIEAGAVDYVNAHATATEQGDIAECAAIAEVFGADTPVSSLKGHLGHTMAASGALELAACVEMLRRGVLVPTLNLDEVDPACACVLHQREVAQRRIDTLIKNNFALGGVNSSIILRRYV